MTEICFKIPIFYFPKGKIQRVDVIVNMILKEREFPISSNSQVVFTIFLIFLVLSLTHFVITNMLWFYGFLLQVE